MSKKITIEKTKLEDLYITQNLSKPEVCAALNISEPTFLRNIREYGIIKSKEAMYAKHRNSKDVDISDLNALYLERNLSKEECSNQLGISIYELDKQLTQHNIAKSDKQLKECHTRQVSETAKTRDYKIVENRRAKYKQTCLDRYGVDNPAKTQQSRDKISSAIKEGSAEALEARRTTCMNIYGVDSVSRVDYVLQKRIRTNNLLYGGNGPGCDPKVLEKARQTSLANWGCEYPMQNAELHNKASRYNPKQLSKLNISFMDKLPEGFDVYKGMLFWFL